MRLRGWLKMAQIFYYDFNNTIQNAAGNDGPPNYTKENILIYTSEFSVGMRHHLRHIYESIHQHLNERMTDESSIQIIHLLCSVFTIYLQKKWIA